MSQLATEREWVRAFLKRYDALDRVLVAAGMPATSRWWRAEIERFMRSGRRRWIIRAGRRAGKSSTLCRLAVCWALWGVWKVPLGDVAVIPFVSVDREEAGARLRTIGDILTVLGLDCEKRADEIEILSKRLVFRVTTCSTRGVVGFTSVACFADEMARWESRDSSANPAGEVMSSLRPTMATQPEAFEVCSSSPWSEADYHAQLFDEGDDDFQITSFAATWTAHPALTEARTRELEPDHKKWLREYAAIPQSSVTQALDSDAVRSAARALPPGLTRAAPVVCLDFSSGRGDSVVWAAMRWAWQIQVPEFRHQTRHEFAPGVGCVPYEELILDRAGAPIPNPDYRGPTPALLVIDAIRSIEGAFWRSVPSSQLVARIAADCRAWGAPYVIGDQHSSYALEGMFKGQGVGFTSVAWTNPNKVAAVERIKRWFRDQQIILPEPTPGTPAARLLEELLAFEEKLLPSGTTTYGARRGGHDDHAATLITAAIADAEGLLPTSPTTPVVHRDFTNLPDYS